MVLGSQPAPSAGRAPASAARSVVCASAQEARQLGRRPGRAERQRSADGGPLDARRAAGAVGVGDEDAADLLERRREDVGGEPAGDPAEVLLGAGQRRRPGAAAPSPPPGPPRAASACSARRLARRAAPPARAAAAALVLELGLGLGIALDRVGRELVDVGEDRLGEQAQLLGVEIGLAPAAARGAARPPGPDPVGGLKRVERPPLAQLAAAEPDRPRGPARGPPRDRGPGRRTAAAPHRHRCGCRARSCPRADGRTRGPRGRSRRGSPRSTALELGLDQVGDAGGRPRQGSESADFVICLIKNCAKVWIIA